MKSLIITLCIFACTGFAAQAQQKMALPANENHGPAKYSEVTPISFTTDARSKKVRLTTNAKRMDPVTTPAPYTNEVAAIKERESTKLAGNNEPTSEPSL